MFYKEKYISRYFGHKTVKAFVQIVDGVLYLFSSPFGYRPTLFDDFCFHELSRDAKRFKRARAKDIARLQNKIGD